MPTLCTIFHIFVFLFFIFSTAIHPADALPKEHFSCIIKNCGNDVEMKHPFLNQDDMCSADDRHKFLPSNSCSVAEFCFRCNGTDTVLTIDHHDYVVRKFDYLRRKIILVDSYMTGKDCSKRRDESFYHHLSFPWEKVDGVFLSSCSSFNISGISLGKINKCLEKKYETSYLVEDDKENQEIVNTNCKKKEMLPLKVRVFRWCTPNDLCVKNCNVTSDGYCPWEFQLVRYFSRREGKKKKMILIGVSVGGSIFLLLVCLSFLYFWRHRLQGLILSSSSPLKRIVPSKAWTGSDTERESNHFNTHVFTYEALKEATNNFDQSKEIGDGAFGTVYYGKLTDGRSVAVKRLYQRNKQSHQFMNEVDILSQLHHRNLVTLYGCSSTNSRDLLLVYEFVPNGTVADHLHGSKANTGNLTWPIRLNIALETAEALAYLHAVKPPVIHRDVKTNNILLDNDYRVKVADFGLSRLFPLDVTHVSTAPQGTPGYVDPDYHTCYQLTDKSDVYSFGVVLIELISSMPAVDITRKRGEINLSSLAIDRIQNDALQELVDPNLGYESDYTVRRMIKMVSELAFRCLQVEKDARPSMNESVEMLKRIQKGWRVKEGGDGDDSLVNTDLWLMKNLPGSPTSVTDLWNSTDTCSHLSV